MLEMRLEGAIAWCMLDRPDQLNAMPRSFWPELRDAAAATQRDPAIRVVVFHGAGPAFSVGGDIEDFKKIGDLADRREYMREAQSAYRAVERLTKPTIAAVHGHASGGGCELTLVCDIVVADETAMFSTPEASVGLVPGIGVVRGRAQCNLHWMKYMVMTGLPLSAGEARLAGLVNTVVPAGQHLIEAQRLADAIASRSPLALAVGKELLDRGSEEGYAYAAEAIALLQGAEDFAEGISAFTERRSPVFPGSSSGV
jgi:enoyl-CoA hydratase/carnithine racemase